MLRKRTYVWGAVACAAASIAAGSALAAPPAGIGQGPNTTTDPYVLPVGEGVATRSLLTVGDSGAADDGREMVGIPDGLGAYKGKDHSFTLLMNQELEPTQGIARRHGQMGAFVTQLGINGKTLGVETGDDLIGPGVLYWDYPTQTYGTTASTGGPNPRDASDTFLAQAAAFARFCSSNLSAPGILKHGDRGYDGQIYFANEENGNEGRAFGVTTDGVAQQLPRLGMASWENTQVADTDSDLTLTIGDEDGPTTGSQLWVHGGLKQKTGTPFDRAGLTNGLLAVVDLADEAVDSDAEFRTTYGKGVEVPFTLGADEIVDWDSSGARQNSDALAKGLSLNRIEDGNFDPKHRDDYYFITTQGGNTTPDPADPSGTSRDGGGLWRLRFDDVRHPEQGGTLELLLDGTEAPLLNKPDNMTIDGHGNLLIQEDPGGNNHVARIVAYDIKTGERGVLATFDPNLFAAGSPDQITNDEESSGIIDAQKLLGDGWFLFDAQVHASSGDAETVELGQLLALYVKKFEDVYTDE